MARVQTEEQKARAKARRQAKAKATRRRPVSDTSLFKDSRAAAAAINQMAVDPALMDAMTQRATEVVGEEIHSLETKITALSAQLGFIAQHLSITQDRYIASLIETQRLTFDQGAARIGQERAFVEQQLAAIAAQFAPPSV